MRIINGKLYQLYLDLPPASIAQPGEPGTPNLRVLGSVLGVAFSVTMMVTKSGYQKTTPKPLANLFADVHKTFSKNVLV